MKAPKHAVRPAMDSPQFKASECFMPWLLG